MINQPVPLICLIGLFVLLLPQTAQTFDDESLKQRVKPAIEAGVEYLKNIQLRSGVWAYNDNQGSLTDPNTIGATALVGIALMECNVPVNNRQIQAAYSVIRQAASNPGLNSNYAICLCVLFLDRINRDNRKDHKDVGTIKALARRIAGGQANNGAWGYTYPSGATDNSNTQFAVVALWVARKYATNSEKYLDTALAGAEVKLRGSQQQDGGWGYDPSNAQMVSGSTGSMTCAGLLGLALHAGAKRQSQQANFQGAGGSGSSGNVIKSLDTDAMVVRGRTYLLQELQKTITTGSGGGFHGPPYFMWSLERVATLFKWRKIDGIDWFEIGANFLISRQQRRGNWNFGIEDTTIDTAFCLLFLGKSNLLGELQEAVFDGRDSIAGGPALPKEKKPETKALNSQQEAKSLAEKLLNALPPQQAEILNALTDGKGGYYTDALVDAISKLTTNASKEAAREALANRLRRMKTNVLGDYMQEGDRELRLAAAVAVRLKNDKNDPNAAAQLIPLLADQDIGVSTAALDSLKAISGQDFGKSVERWSRWLDTLPKKP